MLETLAVTGQIPEIRWEHGDDLCDCTFQRIGWWTNPYIGATQIIRLCCAWKKLTALFPEFKEFIQEVPAFDNANTGKWETEPAVWDSIDSDMPRALWYRQIRALTGKPLDEIRREFAHLNPPKRVVKNG